MSTPSTSEKAPVLDQNLVHLTNADASLFSSDPAIASIEWAEGPLYAVGQSAGTCTLQATRLSDNAEATLEVTVTEEPFSISLGTPVPK